MANLMRIFYGIIILLTALTSTAEAQPAQKRIFRAGASISNITPPLGLPIVGNYVSPLATYVHDQLHARCLVLDDGETRIAFVVVDNVGVDQPVFDEAKRQVTTATGLPATHMLMAATHTHSATSAGGLGEKRRGWNGDGSLDEYQTFLARRISDGVQVAIRNLAPARIAWGVGSAPRHLFNRRWKMKKPVMNPFGVMESVVMNPGFENPNLLEPAGPTDPQVSFISIQSTEGKPIALLANYSLHYVGGVPDGHISADYFAVFADRIQELLQADRQDPPFVGILSNGTSGDVNNLDFSRPPWKQPPYEKMRYVANDVAKEVLRVYKTLEYQPWVRLQALQSELTLDVRRATPEMLAYAENILAQPDSVKPAHPLGRIYAERVLQMQKEWPDQVTIILQAFRIGDLGIAAIPFETFTETGLEIKSKSPFKPTFTMELANGSYGYLPTPEQHAKGGYETWLTTNKVQKDATVRIAAAIMDMFSKMK
jgi:hypothetical protein